MGEKQFAVGLAAEVKRKKKRKRHLTRAAAKKHRDEMTPVQFLEKFGEVTISPRKGK